MPIFAVGLAEPKYKRLDQKGCYFWIKRLEGRITCSVVGLMGLIQKEGESGLLIHKCKQTNLG